MKIGIIAGIHEDITRLEEAINLLNQESCDIKVSLGDIVGYSVPYYGYFKSRDAHKVVQFVKGNCKYSVAGNHDIFAVGKIPQNSMFKYPSNWYGLRFLERKKISKSEVWVYEDELPSMLDKDDEEYLQSLLEYQIESFGDIKIMFSHYVKPNIVGDYSNWDVEREGMQEHFDFMKQQDCKISFFSHDLQNGVKIFHHDKAENHPFGEYNLKNFPVGVGCPWVANGTEENGVLVLDTEKLSIKVLPLNTQLHRVPDWIEK